MTAILCIISAMIGGSFGMFIMALMQDSAQRDEEEERLYSEYEYRRTRDESTREEEQP